MVFFIFIFSATVAVRPGQEVPLKLVIIVQNEGFYLWDIRLRQIRCTKLSHFRRPPVCGAKIPVDSAVPFYQLLDLWRNAAWNPTNQYTDRVWWRDPGPAFNRFYYGTFHMPIMICSATAAAHGGRWWVNITYLNFFSLSETTRKALQSGRGLEDQAQDRIIGGSDADLHEFPWQVAIILKRVFFCGGVVINDEYVLSAAHCFLAWVKVSVPLGLFFTAHVRCTVCYNLKFLWYRMLLMGTNLSTYTTRWLI